MRLKKQFLAILTVFLIALILRLGLAPLGFHVDILSTADWGEWIFKNGLKGFYENTIWTCSWPTQLPLANLLYFFDYYLYQKIGDLFVLISSTIANYRLAPTKFLWWFDFVKWFGTSLYQPTSFLVGYLLTIKFVAILADIILATIIYFLARKLDKSKAILLGTLYLFSPFSFYLSSLWGQYDQVGFLFTVAAFILLTRGVLYIAPLFFLISVLLKPTFLIFTPFFFYLYLKSKPNLKHILFGVASSALLFISTTAVFTDKNLFDFITKDLVRIVFYKAEFRVSTHSYNFWHILIGNQAMHQDSPFLFVPAKIWGYGIFLALNLLAFKITRNLTKENLFKAMFIIGAGGWLFLTNMLERYFFAGVVSLLCLSIYKPSLIKYWVVLSLSFWINLYDTWWYPQWLDPLRQTLLWQNGLMTRLLSVINVAIFLRVLLIIIPVKNWRFFG